VSGGDPQSDPFLARTRERIGEIDHAILEAVNARVELVTRLRRHKAENGYPFVDPAREDQLVSELVAENPGPLSAEAVEELFRAIVEIGKREAARLDRAD
jgi:chorismate mutase